MLKKLALVSLLVLGGCAGKSTATVISDIQQATVQACLFLPTAATVANILAAGNPAVTAVTDVAQAICAALTAKGFRKGLTAPSVNGVIIHGRYVR